MASASRTIYVGVTNDLERRVWEHRTGRIEGFTKMYAVKKLVYLEAFPRIDEAIAREKQLKGWLRARKVAPIEEQNPRWNDLAWSWFPEETP